MRDSPSILFIYFLQYRHRVEEWRRLDSMKINTRLSLGLFAAWALCVRLQVSNTLSSYRISSQMEQKEGYSIIISHGGMTQSRPNGTTTTTRPLPPAILPRSLLCPCPPYNPVPPTSLGTTPQVTTFDTAVNTTTLSLAVGEDDAQIILMPSH